MRTIRLGIIGSGGMAGHHAQAFPQVEGAEISAIASRNAETGRALATRCGARFMEDWRDLCEAPDVDAVVICTHNDSHGEIAIAALRTGKHVFAEYPLARSVSEGEQAVALAKSSGLVLRVSHREPCSSAHRALRTVVDKLGDPLLATFMRLTPGSGARPEILFNLPVTGPPAHFFVYHVFSIVDLFGPAGWVEGGARYEGLREDGTYDAFVNTVNVGFRNGALAQWTWAGGINISSAEQSERYVLSRGSLVTADGGWQVSTRAGVERVPAVDGPDGSLSETFVSEVRDEDLGSHAVAETALETIRVSLNAELSMNENRRVLLV